VNVRRLLLGLACAYGVCAAGILAGSETASAAVPGSVGASWLSQSSTFASMSGSPVLVRNGSLQASGPVRSVASSWSSLATSWPQSSTVLTKWASAFPASGCDPSTWSEPQFSPSFPYSPYPVCDPALYQAEVVQAVVDLRDTLVYGLGLILLVSSASMVLLMRR
jgi:hypothetical protein